MSIKAKVSILPDCDFSSMESSPCFGMPHKATFDFKTIGGPWGNGCAAAFDRFGLGLGTGLGQELEVVD